MLHEWEVNRDGSAITNRPIGNRQYFYAAGELYSIKENRLPNSGIEYFYKDRQGSIRAAASGDGYIRQRIDYTLFGEPLGTWSLSAGYLGKPYDFNTRLSNYGFRDYAPHTGRFTTVDPIRDGLNWYVYCNNDPVNWVDLWGLSAGDGQSGGCSTSFATSLFKNDNSAKIYTVGASVSGTVTMVSGAAGGGVYINPKNDALFSISIKLTLSLNPIAKIAGVILTALNIEDVGAYVTSSAGAGVGVSGSVSISVGKYTSVEDARGPYFEGGGSGGSSGISLGYDKATNTKGQEIGKTVSVGVGSGTPLEVHGRFGITAIISLVNKKKETKPNE